MDHIDYQFFFESWLDDERKKVHARSKGFVGDRRYRHFDGRINITALESNQSSLVQILKNPDLLPAHSFYPFIRKDKKVRLYKRKPAGIGQKIRPIMYASHADACIYSFFACVLKHLYEQQIASTPLAEAVIAYRKLPRDDVPSRGKSNIELARDVYKLSRKYNKCAVLCLDVEKFFDSMDHKLIKQKWEGLIGVKRLPPGHYAVFKNMTSFRYVFLYEALERLGYGYINKKGRFVYRPNKRRTGILCYPDEFNKKIGTKTNTIIHKNRSSKGIPQGSPISDIIANLYLQEFDSSILTAISGYEFGHYFRYSDDILVICPEDKASKTFKLVVAELKKNKVAVKNKKTEVLVLDFEHNKVIDKTAAITGSNGQAESHKRAFQYLGFEIDTKDISLRSGTVAAHYRRAKRRADARRKRVNKNLKVEDNHRKMQKRPRHWQYLLRSRDSLGSQRTNRQVHKILKRAKKF